MTEKLNNVLTETECEVLRHVAVGLPDDDIALKCGLSSGIVKTHLHVIFKKINVSNRLQAMFWAGQHL